MPLPLVLHCKPFSRLLAPAARHSIAWSGDHKAYTTATSMTQRRKRAGQAEASGGGGGGSSSGEGVRLAEELIGEAEEQVELLEKRSGLSQQPAAHLGPAPASEADGEEANVWYFAYGSNINRKVFEGRRMIKPAESLPAVLPGWRLEFSQPGLPYAEPAFAAVERQPEALPAPASSAGAAPSSSGAAPSGELAVGSGAAAAAVAALPDVHGVLHRITPSQWRYVLETEGASGQNEDSGYLVVEARAVAYDGQEIDALTLSVLQRVKGRLKGRDALPSLRYLTLIRTGAADYGLDPEYQQWLQGLRHYQAEALGQKIGKFVFSAVAFTSIFPVWAAMRLFRRMTGMKAASGDAASRWMGKYTATVFGLVHGLHEVLRPLLGCGSTVAGGGDRAGVNGDGSAGRLQ